MRQHITIPTAVLASDVARQVAAGRTATIRLRGWSMRPFLEHERDNVLLGAPPSTLAVGDVALARTDGGAYVLHRIVAADAAGYTLRGDGNVRGTERCGPSDVVAIALGFYRGPRERFTSTSSLRWRLYSWWWMHTSWMRRPQLLLCRVLFKLKLVRI